MNKYLGLDVHSSSCTLAVTSEAGKRLACHVVDTNGAALVDAVRGVAGKRFLLMEEGTQSAWLYEVLHPHVEKLVVMGVNRENNLQRNKTDQDDAFLLAEKMRTNSYGTAVFKDLGSFRALKLSAKTYGFLVQDVARAKNRAKAHFRSFGIATPGDEVFNPGQRPDWLKQLPGAARNSAEHLLLEVELLEDLKAEANHDMVAEARKHPIYKVLMTCPGLGPVRAAQAMPVVVDPFRFRTRRQFWSYCGLGLRIHSSADYVKTSGKWVKADVLKTRGLSLNHNHILKLIFKAAATTIIGCVSEKDPLRLHYEKMVAGDVKPNLAKLTIARQVASVFLKMWKTGEEYNPSKLIPKTSS